jgi:hypothetical protein
MTYNLAKCGPLVAVRLYECVLGEVALLLPPMDTLAVIDTSARYTLIQEGVATGLGFNPTRTVSVATASMQVYGGYQYHMWLQFPKSNVLEVSVIEVPFKLHSDTHVKCKIGRDLLQHGVLTYDGRGNNFTFDF